MDLFSYETDDRMEMKLLADRMRPKVLSEYIGQEQIVGEGKLLRRAIETDRVNSIILYGPPGTGKTTLANIIANRTEGHFIKLNAVDASVKDVRQVIEDAKNRQTMYGEKTILFLDEVHRFNTARQDALLPSIEQGIITFIGATTENPFHHVNGALLSRATLFQLEPLTYEHSLEAMRRALIDKERGLGDLSLQVDEEALEHIAKMAGGDIRRALNALEIASLSALPSEDGTIHIDMNVAEESIRRPIVRADESTQYDVLSAFHKSVRGSSDAALFWFFYAVEKLGMDPMVFIRRLIVACSEDIGLANPQAMVQAVTAMDAYHKIGWPEAKYNIAQAIIFAVESPKSNAVTVAIGQVMNAVNTQERTVEVPMHLRDTHYSGAKKLGHEGYKYPHAYPNHYVEQAYLPDSMEQQFYKATEQGMEEKIKQNQQRRKR